MEGPDKEMVGHGDYTASQDPGTVGRKAQEVFGAQAGGKGRGVDSYPQVGWPRCPEAKQCSTPGNAFLRQPL